MQTIVTFITEKLKIGSKSKVNTDNGLRDLSDVKFKAFWEISFKTPSMEHNEWNKVNEYFKKKSNPTRLVNSIKDRAKLVRRWWMFVSLGWEEAGQVFRSEIVKRGYYTEDELDKQILNRYENLKRNSSKLNNTIEHYEKYLEINNVKYQ
jgi:hypothetical protein